MKKIKGFLRKIKKAFFNLIGKIGDFYNVKISPIISKVGHLLTNNFIIRIKHTEIIFFNKFKTKNTRKKRQTFYGFMFISIWLIGFLVFTLYPMIHSFYLSFTNSYFNMNTGISSTPAGFQNYLNIFRNQVLLPKYTQYFIKTFTTVPIIIIFAIIISILINQPVKGKGIWRTIFFLPVIIISGPVINELVAQGATTLPSFKNNSVINFLLINSGEWIANPIQSILETLLLVLWYAGVPVLVFLAGLQKIDKSIYEASAIDGASPWDNFWKITLPSIKPFIVVNIIYIVVTMSLFNEPDGILFYAREHMIKGSQESTFYYGHGFSAAMSWLYFFLMVIIIGIYVGLLTIRRRDDK
ncbi:carbohydrate ABC transporter permease [Haploplasma modicum]|uniref:carbohydrate ABC transporter permease n=1 Tax=Haploplasma modicum TaxID=2150 RepID=UPI00068FFB86|nr:sugar ABC transporter permease [Haploplasma modicum]